MKISRVDTKIVAVPFQEMPSASKLRMGTPCTIGVLVKIETDDGFTGIGEAASPLDAQTTKHIIDYAADFIIGENPLHINPLLKTLHAWLNLAHFHIHLANWALNGIEMALWDLSAKIAGRPLYELWGGPYRTEIDYFGYIERQDPDKMRTEAERLVKEGFRTLYTKVGLSETSDLKAIRAMREGAPSPSIRIRVDANQSWEPAEAIRIINSMAEYGLEFVDQPVLWYNLDAMVRIRNSVAVPIAAHESGWTMYDILNVVKRQAADIIHIDPRFDAGFTGARISAGIAEAAGIPVVMHSFEELGVAKAAAMHLIASCPSFTLANQGGGYRTLSDDVIKGGVMPFRGSKCSIPEGPGLGVSLDEAKVAKYEEFYWKECCENGREKRMFNLDYQAMYLRNYLRDWKAK